MYKYKVKYQPVRLAWNEETQAYEAEIEMPSYPHIQNLVVISDKEEAWGDAVSVTEDGLVLSESGLKETLHFPVEEVAPEV